MDEAVNDDLKKLFGVSVGHETFLIDEGLELLASFKRIPSRSLRDKVREMVKGIAEHCLPANSDIES